MEERDQQIHLIRQHIERIEADLAHIRWLVMQLAEADIQADHDIVLVDADLVVPLADTQPPVVSQEARAQVSEPRVAGKQPRMLTRCQSHQDTRWHVQNWAI